MNASCGLPEGTDSLGASVEQRGVPGAVQGQGNRRSTMPVPDRSTFESAYAGQAPWDIGRPQQAFLAVAGMTDEQLRSRPVAGR